MRPKIANFAPMKQEPPSLAQIQTLNNLKRKRKDSSSLSPCPKTPEPTRRTETLSHVQVPAPQIHRTDFPMPEQRKHDEDDVVSPGATGGQTSNGMEDSSRKGEVLIEDPKSNGHGIVGRAIGGPKATVRAPPSTTDLREIIEAQLSLEILLKHKELRLIDQEFAKCQAGLEQLRRCQIVPYPAMSSEYDDMLMASSGSGPSYNDRAPSAAPWGVVDGPYSRHYQRWLLPDSTFDDTISPGVQAAPHGGKTLPGQRGAGSKAEKATLAGKSRSQRGSTSARLKALPHGYSEPKEEKGPMIVKRTSDGKMVKLVCLDCRRSNFNSAQGFINHCRIAHSRSFVDHKTAFEACGEDIEMDADGGVGEVNNSQATASVGLVHPLIRSSGQLARTLPLTDPQPTQTPSTPRPTTTATPQPSAPSVIHPTFTPSPHTPHLSALFARIGRGGNLDDMVAEAQEKPDVDMLLSSDDEEDEATEDPVENPQPPQSRSTFGGLRGGYFPTERGKSPIPSPQPTVRYPSSTGSQKPPFLSSINVHQAYPSPHHSEDGHNNPDTSVPENTNSPFNLSPNTIEAHTAPSLVSDDGDYGNNHSDSDGPSSSEGEDDHDDYIHATVMDHDDLDLGEGSSAHHHIGLGAKPHGSTNGRRPSAMRPPLALHNGEAEQRHVSFASPTRRVRRDSKNQDKR